MEYLRLIEGIACIGGALLGLLIAAIPRFGFGSKHTLLLLVPACLSAGIQASCPFFSEPPYEIFYIFSFALIIFASAGGYSACRALQQKTGKIHTVLPGVVSIALVAFLFFTTHGFPEAFQPEGAYIALRSAGKISAVFLLFVSVAVLVNIEQMLRSFSKSAVWERKFLLLGIAVIYITVIYLSSRMLLHSGTLYIGDINVFHVMFPVACALIAFSWKRSSGKTHVSVSQSAFYGFITLLGTGAYLLASGVLSGLLERQLYSTVFPVETLVFIVAIIGLAMFLLTTGMRNKARAWMRNNIFSGKYDYRHAWIEAGRLIRATDSREAAARAFAEIAQKVMNTGDISVWVRLWEPNRLRLMNVFSESPAASMQIEEFDISEYIPEAADPLSIKDLESKENTAAVIEFMKRLRATLIAPLLSGDRFVGVVTVGRDPGGREYGYEEREFFRVLSGHMAGEFHKADLMTSLVSSSEDEAFRSFAAFVLHDLKNFASTLSYIAQNAPRHQHNPEFQKDAFQSVYETAEKMKQICNSLRTFSGTLAADKKMCDLNQIVRSVADAISGGVGEHLKIHSDELPYVFADEAEVARVLQNLLLNALEAIGPDGVILVRTLNRGDKAEVVVKDNGIGMKADFIKKELFVPFHTTKSSGLGIGLFHSKKIMEAHKGTISVKSEEGKGTEIILTFPVETPPENEPE